MFAGKAYGLRGSIVKHLFINIYNVNKMSKILAYSARASMRPKLFYKIGP